jgi:AcrR family transcriptional regulator
MVNMTAMPNRVPTRSDRTRQALLNAGLELLVERPIDAIPIDDVVALAGVAKGSFFNHFADKHAFAEAVSACVRAELEARVDAANLEVIDPVARLAAGMRVGATFALTEPRRTVVMMRGMVRSTTRDNPLNTGVRADVEACVAAGLLREEAAEAGVLYWLGLCHALIANLVERRGTPEFSPARRLAEMQLMGLIGLGIAEPHARSLATANAALIGEVVCEI